MLPSASYIPPIAIQLYTVRDELAQDCDHTLKYIADIGVQYVEIADTGNFSISDFTKKLKQYHLIPISSHIDFLVLRQSSEEILSEFQQVGIHHVIIPWIDPQIWKDDTILHQVFQELNRIVKQAQQRGITISYHNHAHELLPQENGGYLLDKLIQQVPDIKLELDIGWVYVATQQDPLQVIQRYRSQISLFHLKDVRSVEPLKFTELGNNGKINWQDILEGTMQINTHGWIIEQDTDFENNALDSIKKSYQFLISVLEKIK